MKRKIVPFHDHYALSFYPSRISFLRKKLKEDTTLSEETKTKLKIYIQDLHREIAKLKKRYKNTQSIFVL